MSDWNFLNQHRVTHDPRFISKPEDGFNGAFMFPIHGEARKICCIASDGLGWRHVSVSFGRVSYKTPSWEVMCAVKDLFFEPEDIVVQFHPAHSQYVNNHPGCLHLWQPTVLQLPVPDPLLVGLKVLNQERTK